MYGQGGLPEAEGRWLSQGSDGKDTGGYWRAQSVLNVLRIVSYNIFSYIFIMWMLLGTLRFLPLSLHVLIYKEQIRIKPEQGNNPPRTG